MQIAHLGHIIFTVLWQLTWDVHALQQSLTTIYIMLIVICQSDTHSPASTATCFFQHCTMSRFWQLFVLLCITKLAQSTSQDYFVLHSLHKALPSTTLYYKACTKHLPVEKYTDKSLTQPWCSHSNTRSSCKDNSITHAAATPSNLDAATTMRSADTELRNTIKLRATASEIAAPQPISRRQSEKKRRFWSTLLKEFYKENC